MKLLIVEDNTDQVASYNDVINGINAAAAAGQEPIQSTMVNTLEEAREALGRGNFDAAIIDLKLSGDQNESQGNDVIREIVSIKRFPVCVYSSYLGDLDEGMPESVFFKKFERTATPFLEVVGHLHAIYKTGITKILGSGGSIETRLTEIFWNNIAGAFDSLVKKGVKEGQTLRFIAGHLYEHLGLDGAGFDDFLPEEVYIQPSIKKTFFTGSIIRAREGGKHHIILTPQCDMAIAGKTTTILAAEISDQPLTRHKEELREPLRARATDDQKKKYEEKQADLKVRMERLLKNSGSPKYYFLPKSHWFDGGLIHFQNLVPIDPAHIEAQYELVATVNDQFLRDIVARFAYYYSRQGSPDLTLSLDDYLKQ